MSMDMKIKKSVTLCITNMAVAGHGVNLLHIISGETSHYVFVKDLSRLVSRQYNNHNNKKIFPSILFTWLHQWRSIEKLFGKMQVTLHRAQRIKPTEADSKNGRAKFKFEKTEYQLRFPFVIYADFESILWKQDSCEPSSSKSFTFSIFTCQMIVVADIFICWMEWFGADRTAGDVVVFPPLLLSQPFHRILLVTCCLQMVAAARTWSENLVRCHPLYSLEIVGSIVHHFISRRCNSQMVRDAGIGW